MATTITAGNATNGLVITPDNTGILELKTGTGSGTTAVTIGTTGNVNFPISGQRITGDFSNATIANRVMFQTSTVNGNTIVRAIPNGTGTVASIQAGSNNDPNNQSIFGLQIAASEAQLVSSTNGTGTILPMTFYTGASERMRIDTSGNVGIGGTSAGNRLYVQRSAGANFVGEVYLTDGTQWIIQNSNNSAGSYSPLFQTNDACLVYSSGTQNNGAFAIAQWSTSQRGIRIDGTGNFQFNSGYGSVATAYGCRAWVNFDGTSNTANLSGTYSQSGTTVTVTATAHELIAGNVVYSDITTGTAVDGTYTVATVTDANTFTYTAGTSLTTSGNVTLRRNTIRASGNVSSVADNAVGDYTVNFTTAMPDANYSASLLTNITSGGTTSGFVGFRNNATTSIRLTTTNAAGAVTDCFQVAIAIFR